MVPLPHPPFESLHSADERIGTAQAASGGVTSPKHGQARRRPRAGIVGGFLRRKVCLAFWYWMPCWPSSLHALEHSYRRSQPLCQLGKIDRGNSSRKNDSRLYYQPQEEKDEESPSSWKT